MLHAGLDLSRKKLDVCLLSDDGAHLDQLAVPPDVDSLRTLARRIGEVHREPVCAVIESMTGARIVHDTIEACGWSVEIDTAAPDCSLSWPTATTRSPAFTPLRISVLPSIRLPVRTKLRTAVRLVLPSSAFFSVIRNTESP